MYIMVLFHSIVHVGGEEGGVVEEEGVAEEVMGEIHGDSEWKQDVCL